MSLLTEGNIYKVIAIKMAWRLITLKHFPLFSRQWAHEGFFYDMKDSLGMNFTKYKSLYSGTYADTEEIEKLSSMLIPKFEKNIDSILELCKNWNLARDDLLDYTNKLINIDFSRYSDKELIDLLDNCIKRFRKTTSYIYLATVFDDYFQGWLNKILDEKIANKSNKTIYFQALTSPTKSTKLLEAKNELKVIAEIVRKKSFQGVKDLINEYTLRSKWLGYDTGIGKDLTVEETKSKISSILKGEESKHNIKSREEVIAELGLTEKEKQNLELLSELIYLRSYRVESNMIAGSNIRPVLKELAKRFNTTYENITQLTFDEIREMLSTKKLDFEEIDRRKYKYGLLMINGKNKIYSGNDVEKIEESFEAPSNIKELKGLVANTGYARGRAKIILQKRDFNKIEFGDILVTKMTNPDFIVVLEKCAGVITDIGGVTSHAAVIARELNKPCIIGTVFATKVLMDNDIVELDTYNGLVKIEKKEKF